MYKANIFNSGTIQRNQYWPPPITGWININMDTAKINNITKAVIAYVCRDSQDQIITKKRTLIGDVTIIKAEIITIQKRLIQAITKRYPDYYRKRFSHCNLD